MINILSNFDKGDAVYAVFLDLSKSFDSVDRISYQGMLWCKRQYVSTNQFTSRWKGSSLLALEDMSQPVKKMKFGYHKPQYQDRCNS